MEGKQTPTSLGRMERADLITDVVGIAQYAKSIGLSRAKIIEAYIDLLKPEGHLLIAPWRAEDLLELSVHSLLKIQNPQFLFNEDGGPFLLIIKKSEP